MKAAFKSLKVLLALLLCANTAMPCTTFVLKGKGRVYFGRNLDWFWEDGLTIINPRDIDFSGASPDRFVHIQAKPAAGQGLPFEELTEPRHREYLEAFCAQESLKQKLGDLRPLMEGLVVTLRTYTCSSEAKGSP